MLSQSANWAYSLKASNDPQLLFQASLRTGAFSKHAQRLSFCYNKEIGTISLEKGSLCACFKKTPVKISLGNP